MHPWVPLPILAGAKTPPQNSTRPLVHLPPINQDGESTIVFNKFKADCLATYTTTYKYKFSYKYKAGVQPLTQRHKISTVRFIFVHFKTNISTTHTHTQKKSGVGCPMPRLIHSNNALVLHLFGYACTKETTKLDKKTFQSNRNQPASQRCI